MLSPTCSQNINLVSETTKLAELKMNIHKTLRIKSANVARKFLIYDKESDQVESLCYPGCSIDKSDRINTARYAFALYNPACLEIV